MENEKFMEVCKIGKRALYRTSLVDNVERFVIPRYELISHYPFFTRKVVRSIILSKNYSFDKVEMLIAPSWKSILSEKFVLFLQNLRNHLFFVSSKTTKSYCSEKLEVSILLL